MPILYEVLKAISDENRYNILKLLLGHDYCVRSLAINLGISESAVSQHLKILRDCGLVSGEKRGYFTHYCVDRVLLKDISSKLFELSEIKARPCDKSKESNDCQKKEVSL